MTEIPVDLTNLRNSIGDDRELERELFDEFVSSSQDLIITLKKHCEGHNDNQAWRQNTHALKGICVSLGAEALGDACKEGQDKYDAGIETKKQILAKIIDKRTDVIQFLENLT